RPGRGHHRKLRLEIAHLRFHADGDDAVAAELGGELLAFAFDGGEAAAGLAQLPAEPPVVEADADRGEREAGGERHRPAVRARRPCSEGNDRRGTAAWSTRTGGATRS